MSTQEITTEIRDAIGALIAAAWDLATATYDLRNAGPADDTDAQARSVQDAYRQTLAAMDALVTLAPAGNRHPHAQQALDYAGKNLNEADDTHYALFGEFVAGRD